MTNIKLHHAEAKTVMSIINRQTVFKDVNLQWNLVPRPLHLHYLINDDELNPHLILTVKDSTKYVLEYMLNSRQFKRSAPVKIRNEVRISHIILQSSESDIQLQTESTPTQVVDDLIGRAYCVSHVFDKVKTSIIQFQCDLCYRNRVFCVLIISFKRVQHGTSNHSVCSLRRVLVREITLLCLHPDSSSRTFLGLL